MSEEMKVVQMEEEPEGSPRHSDDSSCSPSCSSMKPSRMKKKKKQRRRELPGQTVEILKEWLLSDEHISHPYPTDEDKRVLVSRTGITMKQLTNWFTNARKRIWKPMMQLQKKTSSLSTSSSSSSASSLTPNVNELTSESFDRPKSSGSFDGYSAAHQSMVHSFQPSARSSSFSIGTKIPHRMHEFPHQELARRHEQGYGVHTHRGRTASETKFSSQYQLLQMDGEENTSAEHLDRMVDAYRLQKEKEWIQSSDAKRQKTSLFSNKSAADAAAAAIQDVSNIHNKKDQQEEEEARSSGSSQEEEESSMATTTSSGEYMLTNKPVKTEEDPPKKTKRRSAFLPPEVVLTLKNWMMSPEHVHHPYPTDAQKKTLCEATGLTLCQLNNWFANNRKRFWKPNMEQWARDRQQQHQVVDEGVPHYLQNLSNSRAPVGPSSTVAAPPPPRRIITNQRISSTFRAETANPTNSRSRTLDMGSYFHQDPQARRRSSSNMNINDILNSSSQFIRTNSSKRCFELPSLSSLPPLAAHAEERQQRWQQPPTNYYDHEQQNQHRQSTVPTPPHQTISHNMSVSHIL